MQNTCMKKEFVKILKYKNVGKHHDLYLKSDTLLLADVFKESSYLNYWDINNLYRQAMSQKLPVNNFEWIEETTQFNEDFIKSYNEESDEGYFVEVGVQ